MPDSKKIDEYRQALQEGITGLAEDLHGRSAPMERILLDMHMELSVTLGYLGVVKNELAHVRALLEGRDVDDVDDEVNERLQVGIDEAKVDMLERATRYFAKNGEDSRPGYP